MAKKFFYVCAGILMLAGAAMAVPVDLNAPDGVASLFFAENALYALDTIGQTWRHGAGQSTWSLAAYDLPVPLDDISDWHPHFIVSDDGSIWRTSSLNAEPGLTIWHLVDPVPVEPVSSQSESLGGVKSMFR